MTAEKFNDNSKYMKAGYAALSSQLLVEKTSEYLLQMATAPPELNRLKARLKRLASFVTSAAVNLGSTV